MLDNLQAIRAESARFGSAVAGTDLAVSVPSCPEWSVRELVAHLGGVQRFWADTVRAGNPDRPSRVEHPAPLRDDDLVGWMSESTARLVAALGEASDDAPCWTWWGSPRTSGAVARHQVQEVAVHRWDAERARGEPAPLDPAVADDGVAEFIQVVMGSSANTMPGSITLVADDSGGEWIVGDQRGPHATVHATASDLVLLLYGRVHPESVLIDGDPVLVGWLLSANDTE